MYTLRDWSVVYSARSAIVRKSSSFCLSSNMRNIRSFKYWQNASFTVRSTYNQCVCYCFLFLYTFVHSLSSFHLMINAQHNDLSICFQRRKGLAQLLCPWLQCIKKEWLSFLIKLFKIYLLSALLLITHRFCVNIQHFSLFLSHSLHNFTDKKPAA